MLFMTVYSYEPEKQEAIIRRRAEQGPLVPAGVKLLGEWGSLTGHRVFRLVEASDPKSLVTTAAAWLDLGKIQSYPVLPTEEILQQITPKKRQHLRIPAEVK